MYTDRKVPGDKKEEYVWQSIGAGNDDVNGDANASHCIAEGMIV